MKICRFNDDRIGLVAGEEIIDITDIALDAGAGPPTRLDGDPLVNALPRIGAALERSGTQRRKILIAEARLENPVRFPTKIVGAGSNYSKHKNEMAAVRPTAQKGFDLYSDGVFLKANSSLVGPADGIETRFLERQTQHEVELVAIIGKKASNVAREQALAHVAAYSVGLDITMRGQEERSLRKSFDSYTVLGPWLVTADEIPDPSDVRLTLSVNGELRQDESTAGMTIDMAGIIAFASTFYTLHPGDLIYSGTPSGTGPIRPGDRIRAGADGIGDMEVSVRAFRQEN